MIEIESTLVFLATQKILTNSERLDISGYTSTSKPIQVTLALMT